MPELSLSEAIGAESPYKPQGVVRWLANCLVSHDKYRETGQLHSDGKIELFYKSVVVVLFLTMIMLAILGGITIQRETPLAVVAPANPTTTTAPVPLSPEAPVVTRPTPPSPAPAAPAAPAASPTFLSPPSQKTE